MFQFMILTNIAVAQHVAVHLPEQALLRRHDTPLDRRLVSTFYDTRMAVTHASFIRILSLNVLSASVTRSIHRPHLL